MPAIAATTMYSSADHALHRSKAPFYDSRIATIRSSSPSMASDRSDTDFEESESDFETDGSPKGSFESYDSRRRSQTTLSSYDEAPTPRSSRSQHRPFELRFKPVEGPRGPHLFRSSHSSTDSDFDYALQLSPVLPKDPFDRSATAVSQQTVTPDSQRDAEISFAAILAEPANDMSEHEATIRAWTPREVNDWLYACGVDISIIDSFEAHDITGAVLLDLDFEDLRELDIQSFGKRHQLWSAICHLRDPDSRPSPQPTPFQDVSRPCTRNTSRRSPSKTRRDECISPTGGNDAAASPVKPKRRGRRAKAVDFVQPGESISIVAIEQLIPKPHTCAKGEKCAKWRKQQREIEQLHNEHGFGRFPISPTRGGRIFVAGDPGNAMTAENIIPNVHKQPPLQVQQPQQQQQQPQTPLIPSVVASSDVLGPGQLPEFALHAEILNQVDKRDPQENVRQFLSFQHLRSPVDAPPTPPTELAEPDAMGRSESVPLFPSHHHQAYPSLQPARHTPSAPPHGHLKSLPRLEIPRAASAGPRADIVALPGSATTAATTSICRSATASPLQNVYRLGTPASEVDVPVTAIPTGPVARDASQSVPPNMQFKQPSQRRPGTAIDWRRPSMTLPALKEGEVLAPVTATATKRPNLPRHNSSPDTHAQSSRPTAADPAKHSPETQYFGYGADCTHAGWMKKRRTKLLRHEWQDAHFRLTGSQLGMYESARLKATPLDTINVDDYAVACTTGAAATGKLGAAMKAFHIRQSNSDPTDSSGKNGSKDPAAFAFQLVPQGREGEGRKAASNGKTHHFAVTTKDDRIDWMRELMLAKALQQKGKGYDVEVHRVQA